MEIFQFEIVHYKILENKMDEQTDSCQDPLHLVHKLYSLSKSKEDHLHLLENVQFS